jgi:serine O-acetyltransferase
MEHLPRERDIIRTVVDRLAHGDKNGIMSHHSPDNTPIPEDQTLSEIMDIVSSILFPGYFGSHKLSDGCTAYYSSLHKLHALLFEQIIRGFNFVCPRNRDSDERLFNRERCEKISHEMIEALPQLKHLLQTDVLAAYNGDPAAKNYGEIISCYPSIRALIHHRLAHELYRREVPIIPRMIAEIAHSLTGIDIHPGATIGEYFFMDHGTGIVIGETCIIGKNVRLYQGVTLGAKSFPLDKDGNPVKGVARHPIVKEGAIIYSGATILGTITLGAGCVIGGNMWITKDVPPGAKILK